MPRFSISGVSSIAPTTTLPCVSLYNIASGCSPKIREIGVFQTVATAQRIEVARLTTAGTQGSGLTETRHDQNGPAADATGFAGHTVAPTLSDEIVRCALGAAVGAGMVWTFGDTGLVIPAGTANGIGILASTGTGQVIDYYIVWDE